FMKHLLFCVALFITTAAFAQEFTITGTLTDAIDGKPLESATVYIEKPKDSTLITYTITNRKGGFELIGDTGVSNVNVNISFIGYAAYKQSISLATGRTIKLDTIRLAQAVESLDGITIKGARAPITIKQDTLEFNVASFKTKKDASVEDLLKKLPGVAVDAEGNITVNGKPVNKVLVNGKPFFGDDPTIATRNLTKEIVEKIQVTDTKTDSEAFTGEAGDDENKTINITIDEEKNQGIFGRVAAGGGTDERFEFAGLVNYFDNDLRISVLGGGNNTNSPGFSFGELNKMFGGARYVSVSDGGAINFGGRNFGGGQGITNSRVGGANFANNFTENTEITADYFYSASNSFNEEIRNRENILPDDRYFSEATSSNNSESDGHRVNLNFKTEIDSTFQINIRPQFGYTSASSRNTENESSRTVDGALTNESSTNQISENIRKTFQNDLTLTKRYGGKGGFVRLEIENDISQDDSDGRLMSNTEIFGDTPETIIRNQSTQGEQSSNQYTITTRFRYPILAKKLFVDVRYEYENDKREDVQRVFDFDDITQDFSLFNLEQSTEFENTDESSKPEIGMSYNDEKLRMGVRAGYVFRTLKSNDALRDIAFDNDFSALEMNARLSYRFNQKFSMYSSYRLSNRAPTVGQLSPYINVSNPLNIRQGNPNLSPSNAHTMYVGVNNYDYQTRSGFYSYGNFDITNDAVVAKTITDENFARNTTYTNVNGNYRIGANLGYEKKIKMDSIRTIGYDVGANINTNKTINFNNDVQYASTTTSFGPNVGLDFIWEDILEISPSYNLNYSKNTFDIDEFEAQEFLQHNARLRTSLSLFKHLTWDNDLRYNYNPDVADGFQTSAVFWNSTVSYAVLNDSGLVTLKAYDILDQNTNARRSSSADYIQDVQSTVLQQYFMISFSYKFNTLGKKGETNNDGMWFD
ncbi:MAG: hypothetical protein ACI849_000633, partial [Patiriisocius sp.]